MVNPEEPLVIKWHQLKTLVEQAAKLGYLAGRYGEPLEKAQTDAIIAIEEGIENTPRK